MKKILVRIIPVVLTALVFAGCSSSPKMEDSMGGPEVSDRSSGAMSGQEGGDASTSGAGAAGAWTGSPLEDPNNALYTKVVYFEFDRSDIDPSYLEVIRAHAEYLAANPSVSISLEGHCDERGTREYNLGLGERRANAVMNLFMAEGIPKSQLSTISYGEERPDDVAHSESAWAMNRRVVLFY